MLSCSIYFFAPFSINKIPHNDVFPQAMPHAIPQTHSAFYPLRLTMHASSLERPGLGPRKDVLTTFKAVTQRGGQRIITVFFPQ